MVEQRIGAEIRHWRSRSDAAVWTMRGLAAVAAVMLVAFAGSSLVPKPWWSLSGFDRDPGLFVRKHLVDYPVCSAWSGGPAGVFPGNPPAARGSWRFSESALTRIPRLGSTTDVGILLPRNATVAAAYCGDQSGGGKPVECSMAAGCAAPVTVTLDDDVYTQGRALTFTMAGKASSVRDDETFHVWVMWK